MAMIKLENRGDMAEFLRRELYNCDVGMIATRVGVSKSAVYAIRSGRTKWPREATMLALLHVMGFAMYLGRVNEK